MSDSSDLDDQSLDPNAYVEQILKKNSIRKVIEKEKEVTKEAQTLYSDMQTLIYENYNKFITATDTVKKMKNDFRTMENEMKSLNVNMKEIIEAAQQISFTLKGTKEKMRKLSENHSLLKRIQLIFKLPERLEETIQQKNYKKGVEDYLLACTTLQQYESSESFRSIQNQCDTLIDYLKLELYQKFTSENCSTQELSEIVDLLVQLHEPLNKLSEIYLNSAEKRLNEQLLNIQDLGNSHRNLLHFMENNCFGFISDLCILLNTYRALFNDRNNMDNLLSQVLPKYFRVVQDNFENSRSTTDSELLVKALDKFYRKVEALQCLWKNMEFLANTNELIINMAKLQSKSNFKILKDHLTEVLGNTCNHIIGLLPKIDNINESSQLIKNIDLKTLLNSLVDSVMDKISSVIEDLSWFVNEDILFSTNKTFYNNFCIENVRENTIVCFLNHLAFVLKNSNCYDSIVSLFLAKFCKELQQNYVYKLLHKIDNKFGLISKNDLLTNSNNLNENFENSAQFLLDNFVRSKGNEIGEILRKSIENRDWYQQSTEPRNVRNVMKTIIERFTILDAYVSLLYDDKSSSYGSKTDLSSDSSKKYYNSQLRSQSTSWSNNCYDLYETTTAITANITRLFADKIEIFTQSEFSKHSILIGVLKIVLKCYLEIVRLQTFSQFGLQQIQIDTHYLRMYLWKFITKDENLLNTLMDDILTSAISRSSNAILLDKNVIDIICDLN